MALRWLTSTFFVTALMKTARSIDLSRGDPQGPLFIVEPPHHVDFSNSTGIRLECSAHGNPTPTIRWVLVDLSEVTDVERVRKRLDNGTLMFPPFQAEDYRQDVHAAIYRCMAFNPLGTIVSREVRLRAVVKQVYEVQVYDEYVIRGNTAVLKCQIPSFVIDYVVVTSWVRDMAFNIHTAIETGGQYMMMPTGELHVRDVTQTDGYKSYRCKTTHRLTGETRLSSTYGRLIVTDPRGSVQPRITDSKQSVSARQGERVALPCAAQGFPLPSYSWYVKTSKNQLIPLSLTENMRQISGTLIITTAHVSDSATYVCVVNNSVGSERVETTLTINVPVSGYVRPQKQVVDIGRPANFTCIISGVPIRMVSWTKDGRPLVTNDRVKLLTRDYLQINGIRREDRGMYQCHVRNDIEYVQATAELRLGDASPEIVTTFREQTVQPGSSVSLQCVVIGNPPPQISWTLHDSPLPIEGGFSSGTVINMKGEVVGSLNISHVRTEDGGEYRCTARNRAGSVDYAARLNVYGRPYIRPMPRLSIVDGDVMTIKCPVSGYPIESITWEKDGMTLPVNHRQDVHKNGTLTIVNVQRLTDSGRYSCVARNPQGHTARRDLEVIVMAPPKIIPFSFQDDELSEGMRAQISCAVRQGDLPITIRWLKDGASVGIESSSSSSSGSSSGVVARIFDEYTSILSIEAVSVRHNGNYTCVASNAAAAVNYTATLRVNVPPLLTPLSFQDDHLYEGAHARATCGVTRGDLPITFTWLKDGRPIPAGIGVAIRDVDEYSSILTISHVAPRHSGNYTCVVNNAAASVNYTAQLTVNVPPQWVVEPQDASVLVGHRLQIECAASGFPNPTIAWKKAVGNSPGKYQELPYGLNGIEQLSNGTLAMIQAGEADRGYYLCQATNGIGAGLSKVIFINVHIPSRFDVKTRNQTVIRSKTAILSCEAKGDTPTVITWTVNHQQISPTNPRYKIKELPQENGMVSELTIPQAERDDIAAYICQASNAFGKDETTIHLFVQEVPDAPRNLRVVDQGKRSMQVTWSEPYSGYSLISRYVLQYKRNTDSWQGDVQNATTSGSVTTYTITNLAPASVYNIRVLAENEVGGSRPSEVITMTTAEEAPAGPPQKVKVDSVDSNTLKVTWKPPRKDLWNGHIQGYYVGYKVYESSSDPYVFNTVEARDGSEEEHHLHLTNLRKYTRYVIIVQSFNRMGAGPKSDEVIALTLEDVPDKPPEEVKCSTVSAQSLHVEWEAPPSAAVNGVLQGYKVLYSPSEDWNDDVVTETKITTAFKTTLHGLEKNTNYSIQVLAFTRMGDGVKSDPVFCRTNEDVPEAPADIKGALMSPDAIIVVWKPPNKPNGKILKYTVYIRSVQDSKEETVKYTIFSNQQLFYEATNLKSGKRFDFWVTASTNIGEGQSTKVVSYTTGSKIPARIVSFGDHLIYPWKTNIQMPCRAVGAPAPDREWRTRNHVIQANDKINLHANGSLELQHILSNDAGSYSCRVNNIYGTDIIVYNLSVLAPPATPSLTLSATSLTSIQVKWKQGSDGGSSIRVYSLNYKRDYGEWEEIGIEPSRDVFTMENLWCGSRYQLYLTAINKIGASEPSPVISTKTKGSAPEFPPAHKLLQENSTHIALNLDSWTSGGCPILYFVVEYKLTTHKEWTLVSNNIKPQQERVTILGLKPGTPYHLRVTAHNSAGSTIGEYDFVTLTLHGGTIPPMLASDQKEFPFAFDLKVIVSVTASVLIIISTLVLVCFCIRRQHHQDLQEKPGDIKPLPPTATFQVINQEGNPVHEKGSFTLLLGNTNDSVLRSYGSEMLKKDNHTGILQEDICPYATFRIPGCREQDHVSHTSAQYHTYTSRNSVSECSSRAQQSPMYSKVQKQLLQQHPSSTSVSQREEYVSPVSDSEFSDAEVAQYSESYAQLQDHPQNLPIMRLGQHVPDLLYHRPGSTSTETSPDTERQLYQRPGRTRNRHRHSKPNLVAGNRSSSPESPDEDGRFPYPHHLDPPLHFSDRHEMVLDQDHSPQVSLDGGWEILTDMKCKNYNRNEVDSEDATLLIRRFQTPPSAPLLHGHELSEDYTIAV